MPNETGIVPFWKGYDRKEVLRFAQMAEDYIQQDYEHAPGKPPRPATVSAVFGAKLAERFGGREVQVLQHPRFRLHVFTSRGRHLLGREGRSGEGKHDQRQTEHAQTHWPMPVVTWGRVRSASLVISK